MEFNNCLQNTECRQYCRVLDILYGQDEVNPCEWPAAIDKVNFDKATTPELAEQINEELKDVLEIGNSVKQTMEDQGEELAHAYKGASDMFEARVALWKTYPAAARQNRTITDVEVAYHNNVLADSIQQAYNQLQQMGVSKENITQALAIHDRQTLSEYSLLFDENMCRTVTELCVNASAGRSSLVVGDKGIAKTQAAKYVSGLYAPDGKPRFISGDGSMMKDEFMGKTALIEKNGATVTVYKQGIILECMQLGIPLVIDEINVPDVAIIMRLQDILLRKPGDIISVQEDDGAPVTIKHGFCVIATANEMSNRYKNRNVLDPAFRDRFNILPITYPDNDTPILNNGAMPQAMMRLAYAFVVSKNGIPSKRVRPADALWLARVAHASEQMYSKPARDVNVSIGNATAALTDDDEPRMSDCITPRKMVELLQTVDAGINPYVISEGIRGLTYDTIAAMQHRPDRQNMFDIIQLLHEGPNGSFKAADFKKRLRI